MTHSRSLLNRLAFMARRGIAYGDIAHAQSDAGPVKVRTAMLRTKLCHDHLRLLLSNSELPQFRSFVQTQPDDKEGAALWRM